MILTACANNRVTVTIFTFVMLKDDRIFHGIGNHKLFDMAVFHAQDRAHPTMHEKHRRKFFLPVFFKERAIPPGAHEMVKYPQSAHFSPAHRRLAPEFPLFIVTDAHLSAMATGVFRNWHNNLAFFANPHPVQRPPYSLSL